MLTGKIALVTGGSRGLGKVICQEFIKQGAFVYFTYRVQQQLAEELSAGIDNLVPIQLDVSDAPAVLGVFNRIVEAKGRVDILVNNAGVADDAPLLMMQQTQWQKVLDVNLGGVFNCSKAAVRQMLSQRSGSIVNIASISGLRATPMQSNYSAAKGGVLAFSRSLAAEVAAKGIRVNSVIPGLIEAGMAARMNHRHKRDILNRIPMKRAGTAEEVAKAVVFLASDQASYIIGQELRVDGGLGR
jgi:3-oxoacyl-[acyl-carrier protein] reductase